MDGTQELEVLVVGAGFAGLYALHRFREAGFDVRLVEAEDRVGGTWRANRYPGARCDVQSLLYSYLFDERLHAEWEWSERYASQPEILAYLEFVADRLLLRDDIEFGVRISAARFDDRTARWHVRSDTGRSYSARYLIMATGPLSMPKVPDLPGLESFAGRTYHTAAWPADPLDFAGLRVGVVGTGSSGVQLIPEIAKHAAQTIVFQRTAAFVAPAQNRPITASERDEFYDGFHDHREQRQAGRLYGSGDLHLGGEGVPDTVDSARSVSMTDQNRLLEARWQSGGSFIARAFADTMTDPGTNDVVAEFFRRKIAETVDDPATAEILTPRGFAFGSKRICVGTDYYRTFNSPSVQVVDLQAEHLVEVCAEGVRTTAGLYELDVLVLATGFDALTGAISAVDIEGRDGALLRETWKGGPRTFLGIASAGFPNLFMLIGPGSPAVIGNVVANVEQQVDRLVPLLVQARGTGVRTIETTTEAEDRWSTEVAGAVAGTVLEHGRSWYTGANVPGKATVFLPYLGGLAGYDRHWAELASNGYEGLVFEHEGSTVA